MAGRRRWRADHLPDGNRQDVLSACIRLQSAIANGCASMVPFCDDYNRLAKLMDDVRSGMEAIGYQPSIITSPPDDG